MLHNQLTNDLTVEKLICLYQSFPYNRKPKTFLAKRWKWKLYTEKYVQDSKQRRPI